MVAGAGFEPTTFGLWARRAARLLHPASEWIIITKWIYQGQILFQPNHGSRLTRSRTFNFRLRFTASAIAYFSTTASSRPGSLLRTSRIEPCAILACYPHNSCALGEPGWAVPSLLLPFSLGSQPFLQNKVTFYFLMRVSAQSITQDTGSICVTSTVVHAVHWHWMPGVFLTWTGQWTVIVSHSA